MDKGTVKERKYFVVRKVDREINRKPSTVDVEFLAEAVKLFLKHQDDGVETEISSAEEDFSGDHEQFFTLNVRSGLASDIVVDSSVHVCAVDLGLSSTRA